MIHAWNEAPAKVDYPPVQTIGYTEPGAEERIEAFLSQEEAALIDIRLQPRSRWQPAFNRSALEKRYPAQYIHVQALGNVNYKDRGRGIDLLDAKSGLQQLLYLLRYGHPIMLLCACKNYEQCHRKVVYEMIAQALWERERRRLFFQVMRRPEMRLVRLALRNIRECAGLDWRDIKEIEIDPLRDLKSCWSLDTEEYIVQCLDGPNDYQDFTLWYRCTGRPGCQCYYCYDATMAARKAIQDETARFDDGFCFHVENAEGKRIV